MSITTNILFQLKKATIKNLKGHQDANDKLISKTSLPTLISADNETARNRIPKMSKKKKVKVSNDPRVMDASKEICKNSMNSTNRFPKKAGKGEKLKVSKKCLKKCTLI